MSVQFQVAHQGTNSVIVVSLASSTPHQISPIQYQGDGAFVEFLKNILRRSAGQHGHLIGDATSPVDLNAALSSKAVREFFQVSVVEGESLTVDTQPPPKGAIF